MSDAENNDGLTSKEVEALVPESLVRPKVQRRTAQRKFVGNWIGAGQLMVTLHAIAGVIAIARITQTTAFFGDETTHPFVGYGIGLAAFVITTWTVVMAVLAFMASRVDDSAEVRVMTRAPSKTTARWIIAVVGIATGVGMISHSATKRVEGSVKPAPTVAATSVVTEAPITTAPTSTEAPTTTAPVVVTTVAPVVTDAPAPVETFIVTNVVDGDTLDLDNGERVRLVGIDTPENGQCGADEATFVLIALTLNKTITLEPSDEDRDEYGRLLRYVLVDGVDVGGQLLAQGYAVARYNSTDGYGLHPREAEYAALAQPSPVVCTPAKTVAPAPEPQPAPAPAPGATPAPASVFYKNCDAVRGRRCCTDSPR